VETYQRLFEGFMTYVGPFLLLWWCRDWLRRRPRTRATLFWAAVSGALGLFGLARLVWLLVEHAR
jgi:hypothetical protein